MPSDVIRYQSRPPCGWFCCAPLGAFPKPGVTWVQGFALGSGCELVGMCDIVLATENAVFGHPEVRVGTMPMDEGLPPGADGLSSQSLAARP